MTKNIIKPKIAIIGAGAFGGWTAWHLQQRGANVTLIDAWGPGHSRASSGGETRLIRGIYGQDRLYVEWVVRAMELWKSLGSKWNVPLYHHTGLLWMFVKDDQYAKQSIPAIEEYGLTVDQLELAAAQKRYPQVNFQDVQSVYLEHSAGYLKAREACRIVCEQFQKAGGVYRQLGIQPAFNSQSEIEQLRLSDGSSLTADQYVFACGPWMPQLFPELFGEHLQISRQEVYYFGTPAGIDLFDAGHFPAWLNFDEPLYYGVPSVDRRGFKICDDSRTRSIDPTTDSRIVTASEVEKAREFLANRFPLLKDAPLTESRVCQYSNSPDGHLIIDRHPQSNNVWFVGGGSGHSFKLGPALGEHVSRCVMGETETHTMFSLERLKEITKTASQYSSD